MSTPADPLLQLPLVWRPAVEAALRRAFGGTAPERIAALTGGLSGAAVFRMRVGGADYLMRLDPPTEGFADPRRWHACMRTAAAAGVAPRVVHADAAGVSIVDFIGRDSDRAYWTQNRRATLNQLGGLVRRLHETPPFAAFVDYLDGMEALIAQARSRGALTSEAAPALAAWSKVAEVYRGLQPQPVSSHNDLNPRNVVADGRRLWLVDWAAAFRADRYVDLATLAGFFARDPESEGWLLKAYYGAAPTPAQRARLYLARQVNHMFYGMVMLSPAVAAPPRSLAALHDALRQGEPLFDSAGGRGEYAKARLAEMIANVDGADFAAARRLAA